MHFPKQLNFAIDPAGGLGVWGAQYNERGGVRQRCLDFGAQVIRCRKLVNVSENRG
jgi:hypothetical protein